MLSGDFVFDISLLQTILFALFAIMTLFQGRLNRRNLFLNRITFVWMDISE
ncbi:hypothetical protein LEP1GSC120_2051 [Leptospira santarosai str. 200702252]|nr:hypothetical protein LEP1GSC130_1143 [Leptospira santarosai str. 200403458]EMO98421.1 hypothetical protein LEP1GSC120_2051 [Leptospira santarosai str. 200702252]